MGACGVGVVGDNGTTFMHHAGGVGAVFGGVDCVESVGHHPNSGDAPFERPFVGGDVAAERQPAHNEQTVEVVGQIINEFVDEVHPVGGGVARAHYAHNVRCV